MTRSGLWYLSERKGRGDQLKNCRGDCRRSIGQRAWLCALLVACLSCGGGRKRTLTSLQYRDPDTVRYRLRLRDNPEHPGEAFRCYGSCQSQTTPAGYVACLRQCPGFEIDPGYRCAEYEVPPVAACLTARKIQLKGEPDPGLLVLSVITAGVVVAVGMSSLCAASTSTQCNYPASAQ